MTLRVRCKLGVKFPMLLNLHELLLQGGDGGWLLGWVDFDLGSSPGWWAAMPKQYGYGYGSVDQLTV